MMCEVAFSSLMLLANHGNSLAYSVCCWGGGAVLKLWVGGCPDASCGFRLREAFQSQTHTEKIL